MTFWTPPKDAYEEQSLINENTRLLAALHKIQTAIIEGCGAHQKDATVLNEVATVVDEVLDKPKNPDKVQIALLAARQLVNSIWYRTYTRSSPLESLDNLRVEAARVRGLIDAALKEKT